MNVSADARRTLPRALVLALLVGGTGAFVSQQRHTHLETDGMPQRVRLDADPASDSRPDAVPGGVPGAVPDAASAAGVRSAGTGVRRAAESASSRSMTPTRRPISHVPTGRHRRAVPEPDQAGAALAVIHHGTGELNWSALARCEAGGNPHAVDPSGRYGGLYQFDSGTWHRLGGSGRPQDAPAVEQTARARTLYRMRGASPWPTCGHRAGG
ncbi:hypothetical protein ABH925_002449 [Streptacidiphilus sp. EB129]